MKDGIDIKGQLYRDCVFNGICFTMHKDSNLNDIAIIYDLKREAENFKNK